MAPATSWPSMVASEVLASKGAKTVGQKLFQRLKVAQQSGMTVYFSANTTSSTMATIYSFSYRLPLWLRGGDIIRLSAWLYLSVAGTAQFRLRRVSGTIGSNAQTTATSPGEIVTSELTIPDDTWAGTGVNFEVQGRNVGSTGTTYVHADRLLANFRMGD